MTDGQRSTMRVGSGALPGRSEHFLLRTRMSANPEPPRATQVRPPPLGRPLARIDTNISRVAIRMFQNAVIIDISAVSPLLNLTGITGRSIHV